GVVGACVSPCCPPPTVCEKELTASPTPPIQGSKPAWTLVSHQLLVPYCEPRPSVSWTKCITSKLKLDNGEPWNRYETTLFCPLLPVHTCQLRPAMFAVPV